MQRRGGGATTIYGAREAPLAAFPGAKPFGCWNAGTGREVGQRTWTRTMEAGNQLYCDWGVVRGAADLGCGESGKIEFIIVHDGAVLLREPVDLDSRPAPQSRVIVRGFGSFFRPPVHTRPPKYYRSRDRAT